MMSTVLLILYFILFAILITFTVFAFIRDYAFSLWIKAVVVSLDVIVLVLIIIWFVGWFGVIS